MAQELRNFEVGRQFRDAGLHHPLILFGGIGVPLLYNNDKPENT